MTRDAPGQVPNEADAGILVRLMLGRLEERIYDTPSLVLLFQFNLLLLRSYFQCVQ